MFGPRRAITVTTKSGQIAGRIRGNGKKSVAEFLGVPYAKPPIGPLRFQKPAPIEPWSGVLQAKKLPKACVQQKGKISLVPWHAENVESSEDCLYLNIWVPKEAYEGSRKTAVMFWIHGGAWVTGSGSLELYDGSVLAKRGGVIVVTFNYRLGSLGFLYAATPNAAGNMGLHDIRVALEWVYHNIEAFGGDPNLIMAFGESVGAVAAGYLAISPMTSKMVKRIAMHSLSPLWPNPPDNVRGPEITKALAKTLGCGAEKTPMKEIVECLKTVSAKALVNAELIVYQAHLFRQGPIFSEEFLPDTPQNLIKNLHRVSILAGYNANEGAIVPYILDESCAKSDTFEINDQAKQFWIGAFLAEAFNRSTIDKVIQRVTSPNVAEQTEKVLKFLGDFLLVCSVKNAIKVNEKNAYMYKFEYRSNSQCSWKWPRWVGVTHGMEIDFVFGAPFRKKSCYSSVDRAVSAAMIDAWSTFAKTGQPNLCVKGNEYPCTASGGTCKWTPFGSSGTTLYFSQHSISQYTDKDDSCDYIARLP